MAETEARTVRTLAEWTEKDGDVLWWRFPVEGPPYIGSPLDCGQDVAVCLYDGRGKQVGEMRSNIGGWPGYHTHWTRLPPNPAPPAE